MQLMLAIVEFHANDSSPNQELGTFQDTIQVDFVSLNQEAAQEKGAHTFQAVQCSGYGSKDV